MYDVVGAIYAVHRELGPGLNEFCYQEGLKIEFLTRAIPFDKECTFHPTYHGQAMESTYRLDFLCKDTIIVECKSVIELANIHRAQLFNYLRLTKKSCGILANFAPSFAEVERYAFDKDRNVILGMDGAIIQSVV